MSTNPLAAEESKAGMTYPQKLVSKHHFSTDAENQFRVKSACLSNVESTRLLALGGTDGLIELWNYQKMELDTTNLEY